MIRCTTIPFNNLKYVFLINSNIILYYVPFIKCLRISISLALMGLKSTEKKYNSLQSSFFILLIMECFKILPKHSA